MAACPEIPLCDLRHLPDFWPLTPLAHLESPCSTNITQHQSLASQLPKCCHCGSGVGPASRKWVKHSNEFHWLLELISVYSLVTRTEAAFWTGDPATGLH